MSTDLAVRDTATLFAGATPSEVIQAATDAANELKSVITQRHLFQRIGSRDHVLVEGWQTVGVIAGVFAVKDGGVDALPWPLIPERRIARPRRPRPRDPDAPSPGVGDMEGRGMTPPSTGKASKRSSAPASAASRFGFRVAYQRRQGWPRGRLGRRALHPRRAATGPTRDDYALASDGADSAGSPAPLRQPLGFVVSLAGYATTPAEEVVRRRG